MVLIVLLIIGIVIIYVKNQIDKRKKEIDKKNNYIKNLEIRNSKLEKEMFERKISIANEKQEILKQKYKLKEKERSLEMKKINLKQKEEVIESLINHKFNETMKKIFDEFCEKEFNNNIRYFEEKPNPSKKTAEFLREIKDNYKFLQTKSKRLELILSEYMETDDDAQIKEEVFDTEERAYKYSGISREEWEKLSYVEKLDLTIERYKKKYKSKLDIGLEFERYCGYLYEKEGYTVEYNGILKGKIDGGIDLIAYKENEKIYIQCKYWSRTKNIRENTITQLFGSSLKRAIDDGESYESFIKKIKSKKIRMVLLTKTELSEEAKIFCDKLNILYKENIEIDENYPIVKGVIGKEKIFYIPTDLQYNTIKYNSTKKEYTRFYSCEEAVKNGYRHCYRWKGSN